MAVGLCRFVPVLVISLWLFRWLFRGSLTPLSWKRLDRLQARLDARGYSRLPALRRSLGPYQTSQRRLGGAGLRIENVAGLFGPFVGQFRMAGL